MTCNCHGGIDCCKRRIYESRHDDFFGTPVYTAPELLRFFVDLNVAEGGRWEAVVQAIHETLDQARES